MVLDTSTQCSVEEINTAQTRVRRSISVRSETMRNGSEILSASKRNRGVCFACFASKRNRGFHMRNEKEVKRNEVKKRSEKKQKKRSETHKAK